MSITYCKCVFVALGIQHAMCMHQIVICGRPHCTESFHSIGQTARSEKKKLLNTKICVLIFFKTFVRNICYSKKNERDTIKYVYKSSCKVPVILARF